MAQLAQAQFTLTDDTDIVISIEPPENAVKDMLWLAIGQNPITLYRWSGVTGTISGNIINSKNNYQWTTQQTVVITNPTQEFGIYSLVCDVPTVTGDSTWTIDINQGIQYNINTIEAFNFFEQYASFVTTNISQIEFDSISGTFWCPAVDNAINDTLTTVQNSLANLQELLDRIQFTKLTDANNNVLIQGISATQLQILDMPVVKIANGIRIGG